MLVRRDFELMTEREKLEESKKILEIKVEARTVELKELAEGLEETVKKRIKDLEKKTAELEESKRALLNILEDVEEARIDAEEERNKTFSVINNLADGLLVFDTEEKLTLINLQAQDFFKLGAGETTGKSILELSELPAFKPLSNIWGGKAQKIFRKETSLSENLILEVSTLPIMSGEKNFGNLVILHDITREKTVERMKTEFVSLAAHQLRTPLSAIKWTLKMLLEGDLGPITEEQRNFIEKTYQSNEKIIELINDLLNVARIEEGRYIYKPLPGSLEDIIQSLINPYKEEAERKKLRFEFKKPTKETPRVMLDVEKIGIAIENLIDNAINYTKPGGQVTISLNYDKKKIKFSIQDTGIGIPKEQQKRVFSKFFRGANAIRAETEGTGLGLFISKNIIEAHGGEIWFESGENKGTAFYFTLPAGAKGEFEDFLKKL
jgi:signal transduction histidine kinase